jgi:DNA repair photolyase
MHFADAKGILSPSGGMNIYRGCTHGCIYCDSRSECYGFRHDFEDVEVKRNAPELLYDALRRCMIRTGAMCDPYQPCECELGLMRRCLEIILRHGFDVAVQTKSDLILRDLDLLCAINERTRCVVQMTLTTYDENLCRMIEPDVCTIRRRYETLKIFAEHGIPTVVWMSPVLPFINDTEENLRGLLEYCFDAGVSGILTFGFGVTLRSGDRDYFYAALDRLFPGLKKRYIAAYGNSYICPSPNSYKLNSILSHECEAHGVLYDTDAVFGFINNFPFPSDGQITLF